MSDDEFNFKNLNPLFKSLAEEQDDTEDHESSPKTSKSGIDAYKIEETIATGGLKVIRQARELKIGRDVALAQLRSEFSTQSNNERFLREARILGSLEHANIVPIYDINFDKDNRLYFTMKLLSGETLASILNKLHQGDNTYQNKYPLRKLLGIFIQICNAISYAHSKGIVHLDLKPENVQISDFGEVLVIDWGMAKLIDEKSSSLYEKSDIVDFIPISENLTQVGIISGTPGYMSPEQADPERSKQNTPSDIYSLGAILYSIIFKRAPYSGLKKEAVIENTRSGITPEYPNKSNKQASPSALIAVCKKAMNHSVDLRYKTPDDLQNDITLYLNDFATQAEDLNLLKFTQLFLKRHSKALAVLLTVTAIIGTTLYISYDEIQKKEYLVKKESKKLKSASDEIIKGTIEKHKILWENFKHDELLKNYKKLRGLGYNLPEFWYEEGKLYAGRLDLKDALKCFNHALKLKPELIAEKEFAEAHKQLKDFSIKTKGPLKSHHDIIEFSFKMPRKTQEQIFWNLNTDKNKDLNKRILLFKESICFYNNIPPSALNLHYDIKDTEITLDLSDNARIKNLIPIIGLPVTELDLSSSNVNLDHTIHFLGKQLKTLSYMNSMTEFRANYLKESTFKKLNLKHSMVSAINWGDAKNLEELNLMSANLIKRSNFTPSSSLQSLNIAFSNFREFWLISQCPEIDHLYIDNSMQQPVDQLLQEKQINISLISTPTHITIPAIIEAEDYDSMSGIAILKSKNDSGHYLDYIDTGDEFSYFIRNRKNSYYDINVQIAPGSEGSSFDILQNNQIVTSFDTPPTKESNWVNITQTIKLPDGDYPITFRAKSSSWSIDRIEIRNSANIYFPIPGKIQAEDFINTNDAEGGRTTDAHDIGGGLNLGWIQSGDYFRYNTNVKKAGTYEVSFRYAGVLDTNFDFIIDDESLANIKAPRSGAYQKWRTHKQKIKLPPGKNTFTIHANNTGWNLNWFEFKLLDN